MVFATFVGGARENTVLAFLIDHAFILDHASFRKHDELAAMQYFACQERKQVWQVVRNNANGVKELAEALVAVKKLRRGNGPAVGTRGLVDQVLWNESFETCEMIE